MKGCVGIIQARLSSTRLPGKVLEPVLGQPMLLRQMERLRRCRQIERFVVATSMDKSDDPLVEVCRASGTECIRGDLADVLDRFQTAIRHTGGSTIVRLTADCPLIDPAVVDGVIDAFAAGECDYASNTLMPTYPDGLDVEVFSASAIERAWREATELYDREHVTPYLYKHPDRFRLRNVTHRENLSGLRWTVDTPSDLAFVRMVYSELYASNPAFSMLDILTLIERVPELAARVLGPMRSGPVSDAPSVMLSKEF